MRKEKIFSDDFLNQIGFKREPAKGEPVYGKASNGMTWLSWNNHGHNVTYFGQPLRSNVSLRISKDGDTRTVFNGYVFTRADVIKILNLTW